MRDVIRQGSTIPPALLRAVERSVRPHQEARRPLRRPAPLSNADALPFGSPETYIRSTSEAAILRRSCQGTRRRQAGHRPAAAFCCRERNSRPTAVLHVAQIGARNLPFSGENNGAQRVATHPHSPVSNVSAHTASSSSTLPLASRRSSVSASRTASSAASSSAHRRCVSGRHHAARA